MKIYLASGNLDKKREMQQIFFEHTIVIPKDEGLDFEPEETGTDFYQNSIIKATTLWNLVHCPVIADDSGICVDALNGVPGVWSARYAGPDFHQGNPCGTKITQQQQNAFLIEELNCALKKGVDSTSFANGPRSAHYSCSMVFMINPTRFFIAQETMEGTLIENIADSRGTNGFGYDPIFFLPKFNKTVAEISSQEKNQISHRGKACKAIQNLIKYVIF